MICSFRAEEDEEIAKRVNEEIIGEEAAMQRQRELADEVQYEGRLEGGIIAQEAVFYTTNTDPRKNFVIQTRWNLFGGVYIKVHSLVLANKIDPPESIFEYYSSKVGYPSDLSKDL